MNNDIKIIDLNKRIELTKYTDFYISVSIKLFKEFFKNRTYIINFVLYIPSAAQAQVYDTRYESIGCKFLNKFVDKLKQLSFCNKHIDVNTGYEKCAKCLQLIKTNETEINSKINSASVVLCERLSYVIKEKIKSSYLKIKDIDLNNLCKVYYSKCSLLVSDHLSTSYN